MKCNLLSLCVLPTECDSAHHPTLTICHIRKWKPFNRIFPTSLSKSVHIWQNTKERFIAGLNEDVPPPTLCSPLKPPPHRPSLQGYLLTRSGAKHGRSAPKCTLCKAHQAHPLLPHNAVANQCFTPIKKYKVLLLSLQAAGTWDHQPTAGKRSRKAVSERPQHIG